MVQTENGLQIDCLEIRKGQNGSDKNTVSFHPAISFPPLYPRALRKGVWKIRKSGIWNPESGIGFQLSFNVNVTKYIMVTNS